MSSMNSAMMYDDFPAPKVKVKKKQSISPYRQGIHLSFPVCFDIFKYFNDHLIKFNNRESVYD